MPGVRTDVKSHEYGQTRAITVNTSSTYLEVFVIEAIREWCVASVVLMTCCCWSDAVRALGDGGIPTGLAGARAASLEAAVRRDH